MRSMGVMAAILRCGLVLFPEEEFVCLSDAYRDSIDNYHVIYDLEKAVRGLYIFGLQFTHDSAPGRESVELHFLQTRLLP